MPYNPFAKSIGESLDVTDLNQLIAQGVAEGFYVEYKRDFPDPKKIARSIASFANTYGGWYFIGIETDSQNRASALYGFDHATHNDPVSKVLDPARNRLSHMPLVYSPQIIPISPTHSVLAVYIAESNDPPHITDDGRIYRRSADASDPIPEKDRHTIDRLVDRGRLEQKKFADFCRDNRTFAQGEKQAWVNIALRPQPRRSVLIPDIVESGTIRQLLEKSRELHVVRFGSEGTLSGSVVFNTAQPTSGGVTLRQLKPGYEGYNSLTVELLSDGSAKFHCPLNFFSPSRFAEDSLSIDNLHTKEIITYLDSHFNHMDPIEKYILHYGDLVNVAWTSAILISYYIDWLCKNGWQSSLWLRVTVKNTWRVVPIIDSPQWLSLVQEFGLPVSMKDTDAFPPTIADAIVLNYEQRDLIWFSAMFHLLTCLGIPPNLGVDALIDAVTNKDNQMLSQ